MSVPVSPAIVEPGSLLTTPRPDRPPQMGAFEFAVVAALRAAQLARGCRPRVDGDHTTAVMARLEVAGGKVARIANVAAEPPNPDDQHRL